LGTAWLAAIAWRSQMEANAIANEIGDERHDDARRPGALIS
jgi:hypothetical protein